MTVSTKLETIGDITRAAAEHYPTKIALVQDQQSVSYSELDQTTNQAANGLVKDGLPPNQRICFLGKNSIQYFELLLAASKANGVLCPINWRLAAAEIGYILKDAGAEFFFVDDEFESLAKDAIALIPQNIRIILARTNDALQLYTSGTTGRPKGVRLSNHALLSGRERDLAAEAPIWNSWTKDDVSLISMPCFHIGGTSFGLTTLYAGATGIVLKKFDVEQQFEIVQQHAVTKQFIVPSALQMLIDNPDFSDADFSSLKYISYGSSPIPMPLMKAAQAAIGCQFVQKYGMTETCGTCVALGPEHHTIPANAKMKSVGKPLRHVEIKICDPQGRALAPNETGEIVVRSPTNMSGYWNNEKATQETLLSGNWLRTGDAGYMDPDGFLYIQDRIKDMIISGGENIYSAEVEQALKLHPAVADAAVIGIPDERWGEAVKACVVQHIGHDVSDVALIEHCKSVIAKFKCPKSIDFFSKLPRNASGKTLKTELREPYWNTLERRVN